MKLIWLLSVVFISASSFGKPLPKCNGSEALCNRKFDQTVLPTTHNANAYLHGRHPTVFIPNQEFPIKQQLRDGIRGFMIDLWYKKNQVYTCHALCLVGGSPLRDTLISLKQFLDENPNEVVSIIFESYVKAEDVKEVIESVDLFDRLWAQPLNQPWPTLGEMIRQNRRIVFFTEESTSSFDWFHPVFSYAVETHYDIKKVKQYNCTYNRGVASNSIFILNHFITHALFRKAANRSSGILSSILNHARECEKDDLKIPNFLTVDFYHSSAVIEAARLLNSELSFKLSSELSSEFSTR